MFRTLISLSAFAVLVACGDGQPFVFANYDGESEEIDTEDPNTDVSSKFAYDLSRSLTMNSVTYDDVNDELVINNLPFDGPEGRYDNVAGSNSTSATGIVRGAYESRQTATTGIIKHYAMFLSSDFLEATAAAGADWGDFGNSGANINRSEFSLPASDEYAFIGVYGAVRTYEKRSGIELITGDVSLFLDIDDFDPVEGIQGDIIGSVTNRLRIAPGNTDGGALPSIALREVSFDTATGTWENGTVITYDPNGDQRDSGEHAGMIAGPAGIEMGGYLIMTGVADIQTVTYQVVTYQVGTDPVQTASGLQTVSLEELQNNIDAGLTLPAYLAAVVPGGATVIADVDEEALFSTSYQAREVGVFATDVVVP